jgi:hypothetical protein
MKIHEDKMHKLNTLVKELEVIHLQLTKKKPHRIILFSLEFQSKM